jgi:hypothetical protein
MCDNAAFTTLLVHTTGTLRPVRHTACHSQPSISGLYVGLVEVRRANIVKQQRTMDLVKLLESLVLVKSVKTLDLLDLRVWLEWDRGWAPSPGKGA